MAKHDIKRTEYRGYIIDVDDLGRPYIYNTASPYSEDSDRILIYIDGTRQLEQAKAIIDARVEYGPPVRGAAIDPYTGEIRPT